MKRAQEKVKRLVQMKQLENQQQDTRTESRSLTSDGRQILSKVYEDVSGSDTESEDENTYSSMNTQNAVVISSSAESVGKMKGLSSFRKQPGLVNNPRDPRNPQHY